MNATQTFLHYEHSDTQLPAVQPQMRERDATEEPTDLLPASGMLISVLIGLALWALIFLAGYFIFR